MQQGSRHGGSTERLGRCDSTGSDIEEFMLVDRAVAQEAPQDEMWPSRPRHGRLYGLLRPWARRGAGQAAPAPAAPPSSPSTPLAAIPILSLPAASSAEATFVNPLSTQPLGGLLPTSCSGETLAQQQQQPLKLYGRSPSPGGSSAGLAAAGSEDGLGTWLLRLPAEGSSMQLPRPSHSHSPADMDNDGDSVCSGSSICSSSTEDLGGGPLRGTSRFPSSRASSFACLQPGPAPLCSSGAATSRSGSSSSSSSSSDLINLLMQQAEPVVDGRADADHYPQQHGTAPAPLPAGTSPTVVPTPLAPAAAARVPLPSAAPAPAAAAGTAAAAATAAEDAAGCTSNPLLLQEQAALLSWRRHAWQYSERREPELLRRLLSHPGPGIDEEPEPAGGATAPMSPSGGPASSSSAGSRPRAPARQLLGLTAALALAILLLHVLHSNALHKHLEAEQEQAALLEQAQQLQQQQRQATAATAAGLLAASQAGNQFDQQGDDEPAGWLYYNPSQQAAQQKQQHQAGLSRRGSAGAGKLHPSAFAAAKQHAGRWRPSSLMGGAPRLRLRRLTLLLFLQHPRPDGSLAGGAQGQQGSGASRSREPEEFVFEEWELSVDRR